MTDDYDDLPVTYAGPWQLYGRDIDPTLPALPRERNEEDDEFELGATFPLDGEARWVPEGPCYRRDDPPAGEGWAAGSDDMPQFEPLVRRKDKNGARWVVLHAYYNWDEAREDEERQSRRRCLWSRIYSWLAEPDDRDTLAAYLERHSLMNRWMPTGREHSRGAYLGELPWAAAADEYPDSWQDVRRPHNSEPIGVAVYPTWAEYAWEGSGLDCSIEDGVGASLPAPVLFEAGELSWLPDTRQWGRRDGTPVAQYRERPGHSALHVREDWLKRTLRKAGHSILFGWLGEKQLFEAAPSHMVR